MYLSRLTLNPSNAAARRDLASAYDMHRTLVRVYAADEQSAPPRFLWRLEAARAPDEPPTVLVQAALPGRWSVVDGLPDYAKSIEADKLVNLDRLLRHGCRYAFRLHANATVTRDGRRYGVYGTEPQRAWLDRQGQCSGFKTLALAMQQSGRIDVRAGGGQRIVLDMVRYEGVCEASDPAALARALHAGLGHGKAFGLGLLSLAPLRTGEALE